MQVVGSNTSNLSQEEQSIVFCNCKSVAIDYTTAFTDDSSLVQYHRTEASDLVLIEILNKKKSFSREGDDHC
jgi:hypothetical protein